MLWLRLRAQYVELLGHELALFSRAHNREVRPNALTSEAQRKSEAASGQQKSCSWWMGVVKRDEERISR